MLYLFLASPYIKECEQEGMLEIKDCSRPKKEEGKTLEGNCLSEFYCLQWFSSVARMLSLEKAVEDHRLNRPI
jgi:hypothetical protein